MLIFLFIVNSKLLDPDTLSKTKIFAIIEAKILKRKHLFFACYYKACKNRKLYRDGKWDSFAFTDHLVNHFANYLNLNLNNNPIIMETFLNDFKSNNKRLINKTTHLAFNFFNFLFFLMKNDNLWKHIDQILIFDIIQFFRKKYPSSTYRENETKKTLDQLLTNLYEISSTRMNFQRVNKNIHVDVYSCLEVNANKIMPNLNYSFCVSDYLNLPFKAAQNLKQKNLEIKNLEIIKVIMSLMKTDSLKLETCMKKEMNYFSKLFKILSNTNNQLWDYFEYLEKENKIYVY